MFGDLGRDAYPPALLEHYLRIARRYAGALPAAAGRTRSVAIRLLLAHAATGGDGSLAQLIVAARRRRLGGLHPDRLDPVAIADLAEVLVSQDLLAEDQPDGLALFDLVLDTFGPAAVPAEHQGLHAVLALHLGDPHRAARLLVDYPGVPPQVATDLRVDLANPTVTPGADPYEWVRRFGELLPDPPPGLLPGDDLPLLDRIAAASPARASGTEGPLVSVVLPIHRPGPELLLTVRSLVNQSWRNLEILLVDTGTGAQDSDDTAATRSQCLALDERVRLVRATGAEGAALARNAGLDAAAGEFVSFQHPGGWSHPHRIARQVRPMLETPTLVATLCTGLRVTEHAVVSRPGRTTRALDPGSLTLRRQAVLRRVGYQDRVRHGAQWEYLRRIRAAFGAEAVTAPVDRRPYTVVRRPAYPAGQGFRSPRTDPGRAAYESAYRRWHEQIRDGVAQPRLPGTGQLRRFAAPATHLIGPEPALERQRYDVVLAGDWCADGPLTRSLLEDLRALTRRKLRVAVLQLDSPQEMVTRGRSLSGPVQDLINARTVTHLLPSEPAEAALVLIRQPQILQFPPDTPYRLRAARSVIVASQPPYGPHRRDFSYVPARCAEVARFLFGGEPVWCPQDPSVRGQLGSDLGGAVLRDVDLTESIDVDEWELGRERFCLDRPVLGRHAADEWTHWPADGRTLLQVYPATDNVEVRLLGGADVPRRMLGRLPTNWLAYPTGDIEVRSFLNQIDFFVYFPHPNAVLGSHRTILEALAGGCVVVLPDRFAASFGDAALYCEPAMVPELIRCHYQDPPRYWEQSARGRARVRQSFSHEAHVERVSALLDEVAR